MSNVGVIVATYGDVELWAPRAQKAVATVRSQTTPTEVTWVHGADLATSRNIGVRALDTEWLIFLDADDELDSRYVEAMLAGTGDLRQPSTLGIYPDGTTDPTANVIPPRGRTLLDGNHLVIGSMVRRSIFEKAGGFRDLPILEDWDLWLRCWLEGAEITVCPDAIYRVGVNDTGRNSNPAHGGVYTQIRAEYSALAHQRGLA